MSDDLTDEQAMTIWDDESGTPPPMTAAEMDQRLEESNRRMTDRIAALQEKNRRLERLVSEKEALVRHLAVGRARSKA